MSSLVITLVVALLAAALAAVAVGVFVAERLRRQSADDRQGAVQAAVDAVLEQAAETLGVERDRTVRAAVDTVLAVASDKLGDRVSAGNRELDLRSKAFEQRVGHVDKELASIRDLVARLQQDSAQQHGALVENLQQVTQVSTTLAQTTQHLREALASPKQRGQWGERMADDVLRAAGFKEGINYRRQRALESGSIPDLAFLLPGDLEVRMDVKFPVDNYLRVLEADTDPERARFTKAFVRDVRGRVRELARRDYVDALDTVDCVLMFVPNEAVYAFLHEADTGLLDEAMGQKVVLCSPATLFAVLAVIRQAVDHFHLERTSDEILRCLGGVTEQWQRFSDHLDTVGKRLESASKGFEELRGVRRRQFEKQLDEVERLRVAAGADPHEARGGEELVARRAAGDIRSLPLASDDRHVS